MANDVKAAGDVSSVGDDDILRLMRKRLTIANSAYSNSREDELDDLRFKAASPDHPEWQWPQDVLSARGAVQGQTLNARPSLVMNRLPQHVFQITNDQRQNRPAGKVIPVGDGADEEVAEILNGIVRHIEYLSDADVAYDTACDQQVTFGEGYIRLLTEYCDEMSFDQEIKIGRVKNAFSVYLDPTIQDPCGSDAMWAFIMSDMTKDEFEKTYPDAEPISAWKERGIGDEDLANWMDGETIRIAEYFYIEEEEKTLRLWPGGQPVLADSPEDKRWQAMYSAVQVKPKERKTSVRKVKWCKSNGFEKLEEGEWLGKWIPIIRVIGNEYEIDGETFISGLIRNAKDAQRMFNYWTSQEAEMLALAPKAPFIGYAGQFEGFEDKWKTANINNYPYLEANPVVDENTGQILPLPQRAMPPMASQGLLQAKMGASDDIKATTGQYDSSLGQRSNETSGKAIIAREKQADTGTYHYVDNLARAIRYMTRQIIDLVPKIYDTKRIARIVGVDGTVDHAMIDPSQPVPVSEVRDERGAIKKIYNPSIGKYDVMATSGPSYMTKRQEAMNSMAQLLQGNPQLWQVAGDLFIKNMDWPGADEMAERFSRTIPPAIKGNGEEDPEVSQLHQTIEQMQQQMQQMGQVIQSFPQSVEMLKVQNQHYEADIKAYAADTQRMQALAAAMTPDQIQMIVLKTITDLASQPSLEQEEPVSLEQGEAHMQSINPM